MIVHLAHRSRSTESAIEVIGLSLLDSRSDPCLFALLGAQCAVAV
jgi:hypothetical protein